MQRCSVLRELTAWETQSLGRSLWWSTGVRGHHGLCHLRPLRAGFWPPCSPSPPPRADFVQKQGHGRDSLSLEKPPPHPATDSASTLRIERPSVALVGYWGWSCVSGRLRAGVEAFREAARAGLALAGPQRVQTCFRAPSHLGPLGPAPVTSSHSSLASPPSTLPPPLSRVPSAVGSTSLLLRAWSPLGLAWHTPPTPRAPSHAICSSYSLQAGPPPCLSARNCHSALLSLQVALLSTSFVYNARRTLVLSGRWAIPAGNQFL